MKYGHMKHSCEKILRVYGKILNQFIVKLITIHDIWKLLVWSCFFFFSVLLFFTLCNRVQKFVWIRPVYLFVCPPVSILISINIQQIFWILYMLCQFKVAFLLKMVYTSLMVSVQGHAINTLWSVDCASKCIIHSTFSP